MSIWPGLMRWVNSTHAWPIWSWQRARRLKRTGPAPRRDAMDDKSLKRALFVAIGLCTLLAAALAYTVSHRDGRVHAEDDSDAVVASGPVDEKPATKAPRPASTDEPPLSPIQLSSRRMQEIGVTTALVEMKETSSEVQAPGSVAMDEQRLSSVQTRFPGWIRTVFANATYQYVKKGQSLFTIYS